MFKNVTIIGMMVAGCILSGCKSEMSFDTSKVAKCETTYVVAVGMEYSTFAGSCPGAEFDAKRMSSLLGGYSTHVRSFYNSSARKADVKAAMTEAASNAELFIFYYSGHGGQGRFWDTGADEDDGMDEYLCLYDTYMRDNEVWEVISKAKGRVMCIFDACHSENIWKNVSPFLTANIPLAVTHNESGPINLLVWSGCPANTYSYGSSSGGKMTNTLLKYFTSAKTYDYLWNEMENDSDLKQYEIIQRTIMGSGFTMKPVFQ